MNQRWMMRICVVAIGIAAGTCGPEDEGAAIEMRCRESSTPDDGYLDAFCTCYVEMGVFADKASCLAAAKITDEELDCVCTAYAKYPESTAYLDCVEPVQDKYQACVFAAGCDAVKLEACSDPFIDALEACELPPDALVDDLEKCVSSMP